MNGVGLFFLLLLLLVILPVAGFIGFTRWRAHKRGLPPPPLSAYNPFKRSNNSSNPYGNSSSSSSGGGGPINWVKDKFATMRDHRAGQGYAGRTRGARGFGPLDPDAAWDDRVALEADDVDGYGYAGAHGHGGAGHGRASYSGYEEQELGMHAPSSGGGRSAAPDHGPYGLHAGSPAAAMPSYGEERGRSRSREDLSLSYHGASSMDQHELDARYDATVHGGAGGGGGGMGVGGGYSGGAMRGLSPRPAESPSGASRHERRSMFREDM